MTAAYCLRRSSPRLAAVALWAGLAANSAAQGTFESERAALEALYAATGGPGWTDSTKWGTAAPLGEWYGVYTSREGRVTALQLDDNGLTGPIPSVLGDLARLALWSLQGNDLTGPIPDELGSLGDLFHLDLSRNALTGSLPAWLGSLDRLEVLSLYLNDLTGPIPDELGSLENLVHLDLEGNALTGSLPASLGSLASLQNLYLQANDLTGPIPDELGSLAKLERLNVSYNWGLTGPWSPGLPLSQLKTLDIFVTRACVPAAWGVWLEAIEFLGQVCGSGTDVTIDVAVFHTASAREGAGGAVAIGAEIDLMVAEANQAFAASGVHHRLRLVARSEVAYRETGDSHVDLQRFIDPSDGYMDEVNVVRDRVGADLVHLIVDAGNAGGLAGIGEFSGLSCQTCGGGVFTHEVGHNLGLWHDRYQAHHHEGGVSSHPAYGYVNQRAFAAGVPQSRRWRTVMSYETQCVDADIDCSAPGLLRFSNPRQSYNGDPLGIPFAEGSGVTGPADAAAVLNTTGPAVALWRDRPPARPPVSVSSLPDWSLTPGGMLTVDVSGAFVDPDGDLLIYTVSRRRGGWPRAGLTPSRRRGRPRSGRRT